MKLHEIDFEQYDDVRGIRVNELVVKLVYDVFESEELWDLDEELSMRGKIPAGKYAHAGGGYSDAIEESVVLLKNERTGTYVAVAESNLYHPANDIDVIFKDRVRERMDGLVNLKLLKKLDKTIAKLKMDFADEGFDREDINSYLRDHLKNQIGIK